MNILIAPLTAVLVGLFVRSRLIAAILYLVIEALFFTFQTLMVLLAWLGGEGGFGGATDQGAFGPAPTGFPVISEAAEVWSYGLVNLGLIAIGVAMTVLIVTFRNRSRMRRNSIKVT